MAKQLIGMPEASCKKASLKPSWPVKLGTPGFLRGSEPCSNLKPPTFSQTFRPSQIGVASTWTCLDAVDTYEASGRLPLFSPNSFLSLTQPAAVHAQDTAIVIRLGQISNGLSQISGHLSQISSDSRQISNGFCSNDKLC